MQQIDEMILRFAPVGSTLDEKARTVDILLATEEPVMVMDWDYGRVDEIILMDGVETPAQVPFLADHNSYESTETLGSLRNIRTQDGKLYATVHMADDGPGSKSQRAWDRIRDGHLTDVSVGIRVLERTYVKKGETAVMNGRTFNAQENTIRIITKSTLREGSLVAFGADKNAKILRSANPPSAVGAQKEKGMTEVPQPPAAPAADPTTINRSAQQQPAYDAEAVRREERLRVAEISRACAGLRPGFAEALIERGVDLAEAREKIAAEKQRIEAINRQAAGDQALEQTVQRAVNEGWTEAQFSSEALRILRQTRGNRPSVDTSRMDDNSKAFRQACTDALVLRSGLNLGGADVDKRRDEANRLRISGLQSLARMALATEGKEVPTNEEDLFRAAIGSYDFTEILSDSANKQLVGSYEENLGSWTEWASTMEVNDLKSHKGIRMSAFSNLSEVSEAGDLESAAMGEAKETIQAKTYGRILVLSRTTFLNDDMNALSRVPLLMGAAAARNIDDLVYGDSVLGAASGVGPTMNEDSTALFATSHSVTSPDKKQNKTNVNYVTGASTVLSYSTLVTMKSNMRKIVGLSGEILNLIPTVLLVPPELEETARQLVTAEAVYGVQGTGGTAEKNLPNANTFRNSMRVVVEPRLSNITNGATAFYLVANPMLAQSIVVAFLNGRRAPTIERVDLTNTSTLGMGWRIYHDVGVAAMDYRGIARSKGAA